MQIQFENPDERPIMERLARLVAHLSGDSWKSAHVILQDALTKPAKPPVNQLAQKVPTTPASESGLCIIHTEGASEKPDGFREALADMLALWDDLGSSNPGFMSKLCLQDYQALNEAPMAARKALDADSARRNAEANKPAFPNGRFASRTEGGV